MENFVDEMINKKIIYNKKLTRDWILYMKILKQMTKHLLTHHTFLSLKIQTILKKILFVIYHKQFIILSQQLIPQAKDLETPLDKTEVITRDKITNEKFALKFKAKISAIKNYIDFEFSEVNKKINSVS